MKKLMLGLLSLTAVLFCLNTSSAKAADTDANQNLQTTQTPVVTETPAPSATPAATSTPTMPVTAPPQMNGIPQKYRLPSLETRPVQAGEFDYIVVDETNKLAILTDIRSNAEELTIPSSLNGYKIVQIGYAYEDCWNKDVTVPIAIPMATVATISPAATPTPAPSYNETRKINVINQTSNIKKLIIPEGVKIIGYAAFFTNNSIKDVVFPSSLQYVDQAAFFNSCSLKNLTINSDVIIDRRAFSSVTFDTITLKGSINVVYYDDECYGGMCGRAKKLILKKNSSLAEQIIAAQHLNIDNLIIEKGIKKASVRRNVIVDKTYVYDKKTQFNMFGDDNELSTFLIAEKGSPAIKEAKKNHWKYKVIDIPKIGKITVTKKGNKYTAKWKSAKIISKTYMYDNDSNKWGSITKKVKPIYVIKSKSKTINSKKCSYTSKTKTKPTVSINHINYIK